MAQQNQKNNPLAPLEAEIFNALTNVETDSKYLTENEKAIAELQAKNENLKETIELNLQIAKLMKLKKTKILTATELLQELGPEATIAIELAGLTSPDPEPTNEPTSQETESEPKAEPIEYSKKPQQAKIAVALSKKLVGYELTEIPKSEKTTKKPQYQITKDEKTVAIATVTDQINWHWDKQHSDIKAACNEVKGELEKIAPAFTFAEEKKLETSTEQQSESLPDCIEVDGYSFKISKPDCKRFEFFTPKDEQFEVVINSFAIPVVIGLKTGDRKLFTYSNSRAEFLKEWDAHLFVIEKILQDKLEKPELRVKFPTVTPELEKTAKTLKVPYREDGFVLLNWTKPEIKTTNKVAGYTVSFKEDKEFEIKAGRFYSATLKIIGQGTTMHDIEAQVYFEQKTSEFYLCVKDKDGKLYDDRKTQTLPQKLEPFRRAAIDFVTGNFPYCSSKSEMGASPSTNEGNGAVSAASLFQVGDRVRFVHGREYDEVTRDHNRDYEVVDFYPNNLVQIRPIGDQGVGCAAIPTNLYKIQQHGFNNGDIVILPIKRTRKQLKENFPEPPEYWVIVDASDCNKIAITRFSSAFDGLEDFTKTKPITWSYRQSHEIRDTGFNIFSYREKCEQATENLRQQHDLILIPTNSRYVEKKDLDQLIAIAVQFFKGKGYEANYAGYTQGRWQVCVFLQNGDSVGSLLFDALPDFEDPNQNSPWFGGYKDFYWRADDELESEIYACDLISDLEKLALPLESERAKTDLFGEPDPFQEAWLEKDNQLAIDDRNPFADKTAEDFGRVATAAN